MCGIFGFVSSEMNKTHLEIGLNAVSHRGPDSSGQFIEESVHLGHRRLAIHDLSSAGEQPMSSDSERFVIIFNGEIYNFKKLINEFNLKCSSGSDTEVILKLVELFGFEEAIKKLIGMFALVVYDRTLKKIYMARDRMGEKPFYYYHNEDELIFCSELKSLYSLDKNLEIENEALRSYFYYNYVPESCCIVKNTQKLLPGEFAVFDLSSQILSKEKYWSIDKKVNELSRTYKGSFEQAVKDLDKLLMEVVEEHLASDVPIGAFLSGGVDSSLICAIAQKVSTTPINTFSIGFDDKSYNEAEFAKDVASHLKTNHTELYVTADDCISLIQKLARIYDEPMSDSSQIPTVLLSQLTKKYVTVCLSGDAGDELFGGYRRYMLGNKVNWYLENVPYPLRKASKKILEVLNKGFVKELNPAMYRKLYKLETILESDSGYDFYENLITHWKAESPLINNEIKPKKYKFDDTKSFIENMMLLDMKTYLPSDILVKVDRASMSASLETRAPFLDKRVVEFALSLPLKYKIQNGNGKIILKELLYKYVPKNLIDRPKMGFGVPLDSWFRTELKDWVQERLLEVKEDGLLDYELINKKAQEHFTGKRNWHYHLWDVLLFQSWRNEFRL